MNALRPPEGRRIHLPHETPPLPVPRSPSSRPPRKLPPPPEAALAGIAIHTRLPKSRSRSRRNSPCFATIHREEVPTGPTRTHRPLLRQPLAEAHRRATVKAPGPAAACSSRKSSPPATSSEIPSTIGAVAGMIKGAPAPARKPATGGSLLFHNETSPPAIAPPRRYPRRTRSINLLYLPRLPRRRWTRLRISAFRQADRDAAVAVVLPPPRSECPPFRRQSTGHAAQKAAVTAKTHRKRARFATNLPSRLRDFVASRHPPATPPPSASIRSARSPEPP